MFGKKKELCFIQFYADGSADTERFVVLYAAKIASYIDLVTDHCSKPHSKKKKPPRGGGAGRGSTSSLKVAATTQKRKRC